MFRSNHPAFSKTFAVYAGAVICFGGLIFAGIRMMSGRFQDSIPGLFGALFGAAVLGWGAGWIGPPAQRRSSNGRSAGLSCSSELGRTEILHRADRCENREESGVCNGEAQTDGANTERRRCLLSRGDRRRPCALTGKAPAGTAGKGVVRLLQRGMERWWTKAEAHSASRA